QGDDQINRGRDQFGRQPREPGRHAICVSLDKCEISSLDISEVAQRSEKLHDTDVAGRGKVENANSRSASLRMRWDNDNGGPNEYQAGKRDPAQLLQPRLERRDRPRGRTAKQRDELAPSHSITSSARASSVGGMFKPSAF